MLFFLKYDFKYENVCGGSAFKSYNWLSDLGQLFTMK